MRRLINWDYFKERLWDLSLLARAVPAYEDEEEAWGVAIPVGGKRRGGYVATNDLRRCRQAVIQLGGNPGFPNLRINEDLRVDPGYWGPEHHLCWGDPEPVDDGSTASTFECGRYYGYSERAIHRYAAKGAYDYKLLRALSTELTGRAA
jgi:hypothetical protein